MRYIVLCVSLSFLFPLIVATSSIAGETLTTVKQNGVIRCGVGEGIPGFSERDASGRFTGIDVEYCRALATAVFGDPEKVSFTPLPTPARFTALLGKEIDVLARNTTWTIGREASLGVVFVGPLILTGQGFLLRTADAARGPAALDGARVAVVRGSTHALNLEEVELKLGVKPVPAPFDTWDQAREAFFSGACEALSDDLISLQTARVLAPGGPSGYELLPGRFSKEPLSPVVRQDDAQWLVLARAVQALLVMGEEYGVTARDVRESGEMNPMGRLMLAHADEVGQKLGLAPKWAEKTLSACGNFGEIYDRSLGEGSRYKIPRGLSATWNHGGLLWAPPF